MMGGSAKQFADAAAAEAGFPTERIGCTGSPNSPTHRGSLKFYGYFPIGNGYIPPFCGWLPLEEAVRVYRSPVEAELQAARAEAAARHQAAELAFRNRRDEERRAAERAAAAHRAWLALPRVERAILRLATRTDCPALLRQLARAI